MKEAEPLVRKMLSQFPDYGKAAPEYVLTIVELLAGYPIEVQRRVCDLKTGVVTVSNGFLPSGPQVVKFADEVLSRFTAKPQVTIAEGSPQWEAWRKYRGRNIPTTQIRPAGGGASFAGWYFDSEWPPGYPRSLD